MIKYFKDGFDSGIFGFEAYKMNLPGEVGSAAELNELITNSDADMVACFSPFYHKNFEALSELGFDLISLRSTLKLKADNVNYPALKEGFVLTTQDDGKPELKAEDLHEITDIIGSTSRYFKDRKLAREKSHELYVQWISNSLFNGYADKFVVIQDSEGNLVGIHTLKIRDGVGFVDLIGVCSKFQRMGFGQILLAEGVEQLKKAGVSAIEVVTEAENLSGSAFYQANGFLSKDLELVYHKHIIKNG